MSEAYGRNRDKFEEVSELHKNSIEAAVQRTRKMLTGWRIKTKKRRFRPQNIQGMFNAHKLRHKLYAFFHYFRHKLVTNSEFLMYTVV